MKWALACCCIYEAASILGGKTPTFTELSRRYRVLAPAILLTIAIHLYRQERDRPDGCPFCPDLEGDVL